MPFLKKTFYDSKESAHTFLCPTHAELRMEEVPETFESPWEIDDFRDEEPPGLPCDVEGCGLWSPFNESTVLDNRVTLLDGVYPGLTFNLAAAGYDILPVQFTIATVPLGVYLLAGDLHPRTGRPAYRWIHNALGIGTTPVLMPLGGV